MSENGSKIGAIKIIICTAFAALFAAAILFTSAPPIAALHMFNADLPDSQKCAACHQENHTAKHQANHSQTVRKPTAENVRGDFERDNRFEFNNVKVAATRDADSFFIQIGADNYQIAAVVGVKYIEQYVAEKNGEFYSLPIGYNLAQKRWINLNEADFAAENADFSRHLKNWKTDCAACHQPGGSGFSKRNANFGISCAACHENADEHAAVKTSWWTKLGFRRADKIVNPRNLSSDAAMMVCAECHTRELRETPKLAETAAVNSFDNLTSAHQPNDLNTERYWANGAHKFSGNEFQALRQSVCYLQSKSGGHGIAGEKISCASCHSERDESAESLPRSSFDNQNCISCHAQFADDAAIVEHTKHPLNSEASNCASCHQPETVYGRMLFVKTHEISVPNPALTAESEVPNACNLCHTEKSVNWAIASSKKMWSERFRSAETSHDKQFDQPEGARGLSSNNAYLRALAADSLRKHADPK